MSLDHLHNPTNVLLVHDKEDDQPTEVYTESMVPTQSTKIPVSTLPPEHPSNQPASTEEPMTPQTQLPTSPSHSPMLEVVLVVNLPYNSVMDKLSDFSTRLNLVLSEYSVRVNAITLIPHNSSQ